MIWFSPKICKSAPAKNQFPHLNCKRNDDDDDYGVGGEEGEIESQTLLSFPSMNDC